MADEELDVWIDKRLVLADQPSSPLRAQLLPDAAVGPLLHVHGLSHKLLHMTLASLCAKLTRRSAARREKRLISVAYFSVGLGKNCRAFERNQGVT
jgi:hypothetical protein